MSGWKDGFDALSPADQETVRKCADHFGVPLIAAYLRAKDLGVLDCIESTFAALPKISEQEARLLDEVRRTNDHPEGFRSHVLSGGGTKGSNFRRINLEKRAASLVAKGLLSPTPHGYEITACGREYHRALTDTAQTLESGHDIT